MNGLARLSRQVYKDSGVLIQEVDEGQPCSACDKCHGFEPHIWRESKEEKINKLQAAILVGVLATLTLTVSADILGGGIGGGIGGGYEHIDYYAVPHYTYEYKVHDPHTGDMKSQHETREGDVVKGYYTLHESDGTIREVHYTADKHNGFNAEVKRIGKAHHAPVYGYHHHLG